MYILVVVSSLGPVRSPSGQWIKTVSVLVLQQESEQRNGTSYSLQLQSCLLCAHVVDAAAKGFFCCACTDFKGIQPAVWK